MHIPLAPKWDPAVDGLDLRDYLRRALEYERSLVPPGTVFPRQGQVWEAVRNCEAGYLPWFIQGSAAAGFNAQAPLTLQGQLLFLGSAATLHAGERVRILELDDPRPITVQFVPVLYDQLEARIVPEQIRSMPTYSHYQLSMQIARTTGINKLEHYFADCFQLVGEVA